MDRTAALPASPTDANNEDDQAASGHRRARNVSAMDQAQLQRKRQTDRKAQQALRQRVKERVAWLETELARQKDEADKSEQAWRDKASSLEAANARVVDALTRVSRSAEEAIAGMTGVVPGDGVSNGGQRTSTHEDESAGSQSGTIARSFTPREGVHVSSPRGHVPVDSPSYLLQVPRNHASPSPNADITASQSATETSEHRLPPTQSPRLSIARGVAGTPCLHSQPTCPLDKILLDFVETQRRIAETSTTSAISRSQRLSVAGIVMSDFHVVHDPLSRMLSDVMSTFEHVKIPEKLGMVSKMHATTRVSLNQSSPVQSGDV
jgi:hypothetical protein